MNKLDIVSRGFPGTNKTWRFVQDLSNKPLEAIGKLIGDNTIVQGVENYDDGGTLMVSDGFIVYGNELLPFVGGVKTARFKIVEVVENVDYNIDLNDNGVLDNLPAYVTRYATCGTFPEATTLMSSLVRLSPIKRHLVTLKRGVIYLGNLVPIIDINNAFTVAVEFGTPVPIVNYLVLGSFKLGLNGTLNDKDLDWAVANKTFNGFDLKLSPNASLDDVFFEYYVVHTPNDIFSETPFP